MPAAIHNITIEAGATFSWRITWKDDAGDPVDLSGYVARMQVRRSHSSDATIFALTSAGGGITLGGAAGTIDISISAAATAAAITAAMEAVYDLELEAAGVVRRLLQGRASLSPEVTRDA